MSLLLTLRTWRLLASVLSFSKGRVRIDPASYTPGTKALHWILAAFFALLLIQGWLLAEGSASFRALNITLHCLTGFTVLAAALFRLFWRWRYRAPSFPASMSLLEQMVAKSGHYALYLLSVFVPLSGWILISARGDAVSLPLLFAPLNSREYIDIISEIHSLAANLFAFLILVHVAAALKHHFTDRDFLLIRMAPKSWAKTLLAWRKKGHRPLQKKPV